MMKSQAFSGLKFPERPKNQYQIAPVYLEPMRGSGERITVVGVVIGHDETLVDKLISSSTAEAMYGGHGKSLLGFADMIVSDIARHLQQADFSQWRPCFEGISIGALTTGYADNPKRALAQVAMLYASLCKLPALMALEEEETETSGKDNTLLAWVKQVQSQAIAHYPDWQGCFNVKETLADGDRVTLHFVRDALAVNIGLITPDRLNNRINDAKIKLWNLEHLPDYYHEKRLILGVPREDAPEMADNKVRHRVMGKIEALQAEAEKSHIAVKTAFTAADASSLLAA